MKVVQKAINKIASRQGSKAELESDPNNSSSSNERPRKISVGFNLDDNGTIGGSTSQFASRLNRSSVDFGDSAVNNNGSSVVRRTSSISSDWKITGQHILDLQSVLSIDNFEPPSPAQMLCLSRLGKCFPQHQSQQQDKM